MKALIICSVHALSDISQLERKACNRACARHGIPAILTSNDHASILATATMLDVLNHLPGSAVQRHALINSYLECLNDEIWATTLQVNKRVSAALLDPKRGTRPTGFVADYPMLTTNLVRSSALLTCASRVGLVTAQTDPLNVQPSAAGLEAAAAALNVAHDDIEVLVAHQRDYIAAELLGMYPRYARETHNVANATHRRLRSTAPVLKVPDINTLPVPSTLVTLAQERSLS